MDYNFLNIQQQDKKSFESTHGSRQQPLVSNGKISTVYKERTVDCDIALKLNNSGENLINSLSHLTATSAIPLTKRNVLREEINTKNGIDGKSRNDEEKENQCLEVRFFIYMSSTYYRIQLSVRILYFTMLYLSIIFDLIGMPQ